MPRLPDGLRREGFTPLAAGDGNVRSTIRSRFHAVGSSLRLRTQLNISRSFKAEQELAEWQAAVEAFSTASAGMLAFPRSSRMVFTHPAAILAQSAFHGFPDGTIHLGGSWFSSIRRSHLRKPSHRPVHILPNARREVSSGLRCHALRPFCSNTCSGRLERPENAQRPQAE
jgi:hypothetical protein